jgi:hypothetical protein
VIGEAEKLAEFMNLKHPENPMALNAMGLVKRAQSKNGEVQALFARAVEIAEMNNDWSLPIYQRNLESAQ